MTPLSPEIWKAPPANLHLNQDEVHVWQMRVSELAGMIDITGIYLSVEERERANRFQFEDDRNRFTVSHRSLRRILGQYLQLPPEEITFGRGEQGKPNLDPVPQAGGLAFNMSHSGDFILIAVGRKREVGVDVEKMRPEIELERLARRFFSPGEAARISVQDSEQRLAAFFRCWTRKEAYIKARGGGLSIPLDQFEVTLDAEAPAALLANWDDPEEVSRWSLHNIDLDEEHLAALAVEGTPLIIRYWHLIPTPLFSETKRV
jgi:4'-phosphopantetheinyl transferase